MKKIYLFIFLIVIGLSQNQSVKANISKPTTNSKATTRALFAPVITFASPGTKVFTNVDLPLTATSTSTAAIPITFTSSNPAVATIVNGNIHFVSLGTSVITASQGGGTTGVNGLPPDVPQTLTVTAPTLSLTAPGSKTFTQVDFTPTATSTVNNVPITFTSSNPAVATIVNGNIHYTGIGTTVIEATQQGSPAGTVKIATTTAPFLPADQVSTLTVTAAVAPAIPAISLTTLGTKTFTNTDLAITATSTGTTTAPITVTSSNPAVATVTNTLTLGVPAAGSGYTNGTYINVPLTGGSGSGVLATIVVANNVISSVTTTLNGSGYLTGDVLTTAAANIGGTGSGFNIVVLGVAFNIHYVAALPAPNNFTIITASQGGGVSGNPTTPPDVQQTLVVTAPTISFPALGTKPYQAQDLPVGASSTVGNKVIVYTSSNPAVATISNIITGTITAGTGYTAGTYYKVPVLGGTGSGATATITTASSVVSAVTITANGPTPYAVGDVLTVANSAIGNGSGFSYTVTGAGYTSNIHFNNAVPAAPNNTTTITASQGGGATGIVSGNILAFINLKGGSGYTAGTYTNVALTGGSGTGAVATVNVANGIVSSVFINNGGSGYVAGDVLSCAATSIGGTGTGFALTVYYSASIPADVSQVLTVTQPAINFPPLGTKQFTSNDLNPGATGSNFTTSSISTFGTPTPGSGYNDGTYYAVPLSYANTTLAGNNGTGATATITVIGHVVTSVVAVSTGLNYTVGDILTAPASSLGGVGSGFQIQVSAVSTGFPITYTSSNPAVATIVNDFIHFVGTGTTTITASQAGPAGGTTGAIALPASVSQPLTVSAPTITFALSGTRTLSSTDVNPGATSTITNIPITYISSNAAVATITNNSITTTNTLVRGSGYGTAGIYTNVALTGGTGTGATATVLVNPISQTIVGGVVVSQVTAVIFVTITSGGSGYTVGDILSAPAANIGGGSPTVTFSVTVSGTGSFLHFTGPGTVNITASQGGGAAGTNSLPADVTQALTVLPPTLTLPALGTVVLSSTDINPSAISTITNKPITYTSSNTAVASILPNSITSFNNPTGGTGYVINTYSPVPLTGGTGTGAVAQILVVGGSVTGVTILSGGSGYSPNDVLTCVPSLIGGTGTGFSVVVGSVGGVIHLVGSPSAGNTTTITASQGGGAAGTATLPADATKVLTVAPYSIVMPPFGTITLNNADLNPGATSTLPSPAITYTSDNTSVATIVNGFIHFVGIGTANITASQGGGSTGTPVLPADVTQKLVISTPLISFGPLSAVYPLSADVAPGATSTVTTTPITYTSSNTAVATIVNGNIHVVGVGTSTITATQGGGIGAPLINTTNLVGGSAYTAGTYNSVPLTGGSGTGALAKIVVAGGAVTSVTITTPGTNYKQGETLSALAANIGGTGSGFTVQGLTSNSIPADQTQTFTVNPTSITLPALGTKQYTDVDFNPGATSTYAGVPIFYYSSNPAAATVVTYPTLSAPISGGTGYTNGTYTAVPLLLNGSAGSVTATIVVAGGSITAVKSISAVPVNGSVITLPASTSTTVGAGSGFKATVTGSTSMVHLISPVPPATSNITTIAASQGGSIITNTTNLVGGSAYTNGTYNAVPLIYANNVTGTGSGALAKIVVSGGAVTSVTITSGGIVYKQGDVLSATAATIGGTGTGFTVTAVTTNTNLLPDDATQTLTVVAPVLTFPALGTVQYSNIDFAPGATSTVSAPIAYTSSNTAVATIVNGQIHIVNAGIATITASQGGGSTGVAGLPADATSVLTIAGAPTLTFAALGSKPYNNTDLAPGASSTYTLAPITYTSSNTAVATIVNGNIHFVGIGTSTITASQGGGTVSNGVIPTDIGQVLTVTAPAITFAALGSKALTDIDLAPGATTTVTGTPITYTSTNTAVATIVNGNIHFVAAGTATIKASQQGTTAGTVAPATGLLPADQTQVLTVTAPVINFAALTSKPFQLNDIGLAATSTLTNVPITYTSSNTAVATIVNNAIHIVGVGTTNIVASQTTTAPAAGYAAPANATQAFVVTAPTLTLTTALGSKPFSSTDLPLTTTGSIGSAAPITFTSSDPTIATIVNNAIHYVGVGTCTITASQGSYLGSPAPPNSALTLTVTPAVISFSPALGTRLLNSGDVTLASTSTLSTTAFPISYTSSDPTVASILPGGILHLVNNGTCVVTAVQTISTNYAPAPATSTLILTPPLVSTSTPVITFANLGTKQYSNTGDYVPAATSSNGATVLFTSSNPAVATIVNGNIHPTPPVLVNGIVTYPNPSTTVITASTGGGPNGIPGLVAADVSQTLTVTPASINFPPLGQQIFPALPVIANLNQVRFNTDDLAPTATSTFQLLTPNNTAQPITYTSSNPNVATITPSGNIHFVGLGSTAITASLGNVLVPDVTQNLEVIAPLITFNAARSLPFNTLDAAPGATSTLSTVPIVYTSSNTAVATIVNGNIHMISAGVTTITATQAAIGNSTQPQAATQVLTITGGTGATGTLTFAAKTVAFSLIDQDPGATSTILNVPITYTSNNPALITIVNNKLHFNAQTSPSAVSTAVITATQAGTNGVPTQSIPAVFTVTPLVLGPTPLTKYYGDPDFSPAISTLGPTAPILYVSGTTATATTVTNGVTTSPGQFIHILTTGTSAIAVTSPADNANPAATGISIALTVAPAPMTITPKNVTVTYGTSLISLPVSYDGFKSASGNFPLDDSTKFTAQPIVSINGRSPNGFFGSIPAGTYQLSASGAASTLYTFNYGKGTLTVVPAVQTLTWNNFNGNKSFADVDFDPLARSTGDPVVYTSSNPAVATIVNGNIHIVGIGTTTITASISPTSGNYTGTASISKTLTVGQGAQTITVATIPYLTKGTAAYSPNATASSGLGVTMVSSDPTIVKVVGTTLVPLHVGSVTITFSQPGNANYTAAPNVTQYVQVVDPSGTVVKVDQAVSPNGDGINDFLYIEGIQNFPDNHVKIINRNGDKVYGTVSYNNKDVAFTGKDSSGHYLPAGTYFYLIDWTAGGDNYHITGYFVLKY